jgi:hypothetical protein
MKTMVLLTFSVFGSLDLWAWYTHQLTPFMIAISGLMAVVILVAWYADTHRESIYDLEC